MAFFIDLSFDFWTNCS